MKANRCIYAIIKRYKYTTVKRVLCGKKYGNEIGNDHKMCNPD